MVWSESGRRSESQKFRVTRADGVVMDLPGYPDSSLPGEDGNRALGVMLLGGGQSNPIAVPEQHWWGSITAMVNRKRH